MQVATLVAQITRLITNRFLFFCILSWQSKSKKVTQNHLTLPNVTLNRVMRIKERRRDAGDVEASFCHLALGVSDVTVTQVTLANDTYTLPRPRVIVERIFV